MRTKFSICFPSDAFPSFSVLLLRTHVTCVENNARTREEISSQVAFGSSLICKRAHTHLRVQQIYACFFAAEKITRARAGLTTRVLNIALGTARTRPRIKSASGRAHGRLCTSREGWDKQHTLVNTPRTGEKLRASPLNAENRSFTRAVLFALRDKQELKTRAFLYYYLPRATRRADDVPLRNRSCR